MFYGPDDPDDPEMLRLKIFSNNSNGFDEDDPTLTLVVSFSFTVNTLLLLDKLEDDGDEDMKGVTVRSGWTWTILGS